MDAITGERMYRFGANCYGSIAKKECAGALAIRSLPSNKQPFATASCTAAVSRCAPFSRAMWWAAQSSDLMRLRIQQICTRCAILVCRLWHACSSCSPCLEPCQGDCMEMAPQLGSLLRLALVSLAAFAISVSGVFVKTNTVVTLFREYQKQLKQLQVATVKHQWFP